MRLRIATAATVLSLISQIASAQGLDLNCKTLTSTYGSSGMSNHSWAHGKLPVCSSSPPPPSQQQGFDTFGLPNTPVFSSVAVPALAFLQSIGYNVWPPNDGSIANLLIRHGEVFTRRIGHLDRGNRL